MKYIKYTIVIIAILSAVLISVFFMQEKEKEEEIKLAKKQFVYNQARISVVPYKVVGKEKIGFYILIESYQNRDILSYDLVAATVLEDNMGNIYKALSWEIVKKSEYKVSGILTFEDFNKKAKELVLMIFQTKDRSLKWDI
ncbi:hypothetical protein ACFL2K_03375 [Candidatus Margulisiibacteriota bacterium]